MHGDCLRPSPEPRPDRAAIQRLHGLVTYGPGDLEIAAAMAVHGYDAVKWAEGQGLLAELVSSDEATGRIIASAATWYEEAATVARHALASEPRLLGKLGLG